MPLTPGTKLGPYEIQLPLGAGGMGEVYRARDTRLERTVAIKILPEQLSSDPIRKQRFEREAKTISSLNHPHICVLHDVGSQDGISYLVMECVEGETLAKRLEKGPLPLDQVLKYGTQIADVRVWLNRKTNQETCSVPRRHGCCITGQVAASMRRCLSLEGQYHTVLTHGRDLASRTVASLFRWA